jgi:hypothetical protein
MRFEKVVYLSKKRCEQRNTGIINTELYQVESKMELKDRAIMYSCTLNALFVRLEASHDDKHYTETL